MQEDRKLGTNGMSVKEAFEVSALLISFQTVENIIRHTAWYIAARFRFPFMIAIVERDEAEGPAEVFHYEGERREELAFSAPDANQLEEFFKDVEFNSTDMDFFVDNYPEKSFTRSLEQLGIDIIIPLKTQNGVLGAVFLPSGESVDDSQGGTAHNLYLTNLLGLTAVALENVILHRRTTFDALTGLYSRYYFGKMLENELYRVNRYHESFSLIMLDIDHFKKVNDTYGHTQGDIILEELAGLILQTIRHVDIAARYGGEEFAIILPQTDLKESGVVAERLRVVVDEHLFLIKNAQIHLSVSLGVSEFNRDELRSAMDIIDSADKALYKSKKMGRNRVTLALRTDNP